MPFVGPDFLQQLQRDIPVSLVPESQQIQRKPLTKEESAALALLAKTAIEKLLRAKPQS